MTNCNFITNIYEFNSFFNSLFQRATCLILEASAIFNAACGNLVGVFLSPILILGYLGVTGDVDLLGVFVKLALRVV